MKKYVEDFNSFINEAALPEGKSNQKQDIEILKDVVDGKYKWNNKEQA